MEYFMTTTSTISQVLVAVIVGALGSGSVPFAKNSFRDFSYLVSNGGFGCLLFSHMASSISAGVLQRSSVLLVFASLGIIIGYISASIFGVVFFQATDSEKGQPHPDATVLVEFPNGPAGAARVVVEYAVDEASPHANLSDEELLGVLQAPLSRYEECVGYQTLAKTSCCLQNATVLPLSLVSRLGASPALSWFSVEDATTYIFVYNVVVSTVFWSWGLQATVGGAKRYKELRAIRRAAEQYVKLSSSRRSASVSTPLDAPCGGSRAYFDDRHAYEEEQPPVVVRRVEKKCVGPPLGIWRSLALFFASSARRRHVVKKLWAGMVRRTKDAGHVMVQSLQSPPFAGTVFGMLIGVTPPLHRAIEVEPLASVFSAISLAGGCAVPGSLLLLGASLAGNSISFDMDVVRLRHAAQQTSLGGRSGDDAPDCELSASFSWSPVDHSWSQASEASGGQEEGEVEVAVSQGSSLWSVVTRGAWASWNHAANSWRYMKFLLSLDGVSYPFVFGIAAVRLVVIPIICFILAALLARSGFVGAISEPQHNTMLVVMLILCAAPSSITIVMMSNVQQFMVRPVAKMLFYQYFFTIPSSMLWLTVALWMTS